MHIVGTDLPHIPASGLEYNWDESILRIGTWAEEYGNYQCHVQLDRMSSK